MTNFIQVTPFLHVPDLEEAIGFFVDRLGFQVQLRMHDYAYLHRETVGLRMLQLERGERPSGRRRFAHYIDVRDVDGLYAELKPKLAGLRERDVHGPADKEYGQRELLIVCPDGDLVVFGQAISRA
jgi:catechol 2,3-dioxygenase-like lactoylglutathione lyase family enzyme